jgi:hypothetical protein
MKSPHSVGGLRFFVEQLVQLGQLIQFHKLISAIVVLRNRFLLQIDFQMFSLERSSQSPLRALVIISCDIPLSI